LKYQKTEELFIKKNIKTKPNSKMAGKNKTKSDVSAIILEVSCSVSSLEDGAFGLRQKVKIG
jgi:hypothetical protein